MRYLFVDRILQLESGSRIVAEKLVSQAELRGGRLRAGALLETMAQAAGWLAKEHHSFLRLPLLAKVPELEIERAPRAGERLRIEARVEAQRSDCFSMSVAVSSEAGAIARARLLLYVLPAPAERSAELSEQSRELFRSLTQAASRRVLSVRA